MAHFKGTATDHEDFSDQLVEILSSDHVSAVDSVAAAGTGYALGEILTDNSGTGTATQRAQFEVTALSGSTVTGVRIYSAGAYTADPTDPIATSSSGSGTGCTLNLTLTDTGWDVVRNIEDIAVVAATLNDGGSGYSVSDVLSVAGGTGTAATITVDTVSSGEITAFTLTTNGTYTVAPTTTTGNAVAGGGGSGALFDIDLDGTVGRKQVIAQGPGSGSDDITVGWYTYVNSGNNANNWELAGMTGFTAANTWENQPGKTKGEWADQITFQGGQYLLLVDASFPWWVNVDDRRVFIVARPGTTYSNGWLGFVEPLGTSTEFPYPLMVGGQSNTHTMVYTDTDLSHSGFVDPRSTFYELAGDRVGPVQFYTGSAWASFVNADKDSSSLDAEHDRGVYPMGQPIGTSPASAPVDSADQVVANGTVYFTDIIPNTGSPGSQSVRLGASPNPAGDEILLVPCGLYSSLTGELNFWGELGGCFWCSGNTTPTLQPEDTITEDGEVYRVFNIGPRNDAWAFFAMKES